MTVRHFLSLLDLDSQEVLNLLERGIELKKWRLQGCRPPLFERKVLAMIFEKSSTRTRMAFEAVMAEGGGKAVFLSTNESQVGRGELPEDTARVLAEMSDAIMVRTYEHETVERIAAHSRVPVVNGLTNKFHPCQLLADLMTFREHRGDIAGRTVAWVGDGNNMCNSYINASGLMGFRLKVASPQGYEPTERGVSVGTECVELTHDAKRAVRDADLVVTDVWASMGQEDEEELRKSIFRPFQVTVKLMALAKPDALFMHCLPAHRGEEVTGEVIDHPDSVVWDEAGNRLHAQKALLEFLLKAD